MGRLTAQERVGRLVDDGTFDHVHTHPGDRIVIGRGKVEGRAVVVAADDPDGWNDSGRRMVDKTFLAHAIAQRERCPIVYLYDSSPRPFDVREVFAAPDGVGRIYFNQARLSGRVPQVCGVFGDMMSARSFPIALTDAVAMVDARAHVVLCHARLVPHLVGEQTDMDALGGARVHAETTGLCDARTPDDAACIDWIKTYLSFMPEHARALPPRSAPRPPRTSGRALAELVPADERVPFPMLPVADELVDAGSALELKPEYAPEMRTLLARIGGIPVGLIANDSSARGGILFVESCRKAIRFIELCDAYGLPLVFLVDVPGFMVGTRSERAGIVGAAASLFSALAHASVARISIVVRKAYTAGLYAMCGPPFGPDAVFALETGALGVFSRRVADDLAALNPDGARAPMDVGLDMEDAVDAILSLSELRERVVDELGALFERERKPRAAALSPL